MPNLTAGTLCVSAGSYCLIYHCTSPSTILRHGCTLWDSSGRKTVIHVALHSCKNNATTPFFLFYHCNLAVSQSVMADTVLSLCASFIPNCASKKSEPDFKTGMRARRQRIPQCWKTRLSLFLHWLRRYQAEFVYPDSQFASRPARQPTSQPDRLPVSQFTIWLESLS